jgi:hypothetical protein
VPEGPTAVTDDQARKWFEAHAAGIPLTRENFPDSSHPFPGEQT